MLLLEQNALAKLFVHIPTPHKILLQYRGNQNIYTQPFLYLGFLKSPIDIIWAILSQAFQHRDWNSDRNCDFMFCKEKQNNLDGKYDFVNNSIFSDVWKSSSQIVRLKVGAGI